jgi:type II secretory ATPase GspE/PulE/Tfp pilus assembly ATPase PilB-like protein
MPVHKSEPLEFISTSAGDREAVDYLNALFPRAAREGVSDIHFEDDGDQCFVRFRVRGELQIVDVVSRRVSQEFNSKIRMKSRMSLVERLAPLDGKFAFSVDGRVVDVRVSVLPLGSGDSIVCRLLDQSAHLVTLDELRMPDDIRAAIRHAISQPQGLFLVTGPTGSGKTTTLYGILKQLNSPSIKTMTIEDPIEFRIQGIVQAATNLKLTFAKALRAMLRQDPDVILVGEIRDAETAGLATQAALTGHIVLSTLHANSATVTLNRLLDLEVDPNALAAALGGFLAQRLVRTLCPHCRVEQPMDGFIRDQIMLAGVGEAELDAIGSIFAHNPAGCEHCHDGWSGRTPVFEIVLATPQVRLAVERADLQALKAAAALQPQYRTLSHDAYRLVAQGVTSVSEAMAVTGSALAFAEDETE